MTSESSGVELTRILAGKTHAPVVYFASMGDYVKIGTTTNLKGRMSHLYLSLEDVLVVVPGGRETENAYHDRFAESCVQRDGHRELFRRDGQLWVFLRGLRNMPPAAAPTPLIPEGLLMTIREACDDGVLEISLVAARRASQRPGFPEVAGWRDGKTALYRWAELAEWQNGKVGALRKVAS